MFITTEKYTENYYNDCAVQNYKVVNLMNNSTWVDKSKNFHCEIIIFSKEDSFMNLWEKVQLHVLVGGWIKNIFFQCFMF